MIAIGIILCILVAAHGISTYASLRDLRNLTQDNHEVLKSMDSKIEE